MRARKLVRNDSMKTSILIFTKNDTGEKSEEPRREMDST